MTVAPRNTQVQLNVGVRLFESYEEGCIWVNSGLSDSITWRVTILYIAVEEIKDVERIIRLGYRGPSAVCCNHSFLPVTV
jgi:hypothetical protein